MTNTATRPFVPASADETQYFLFIQCNKCAHDTNESCQILNRLLGMTGSPIPSEWIEDAESQGEGHHNPRCIRFAPFALAAEAAR